MHSVDQAAGYPRDASETLTAEAMVAMAVKSDSAAIDDVGGEEYVSLFRSIDRSIDRSIEYSSERQSAGRIRSGG